jgi:predicted ArsR family transcriptional regulator
VTRFSEGRESVTDEEISGQPATSRTEQFIKLCMKNHQLTVRNIAEQVNIDKETAKS